MTRDLDTDAALAEQYHRDVMDDPEQGTPPVKQIAIDSDINIASLYKFGMPDETDEPKFSQFVRMYRASNGGLFRTLRRFVNLCDNTLTMPTTRLTASKGRMKRPALRFASTRKDGAFTPGQYSM